MLLSIFYEWRSLHRGTVNPYPLSMPHVPPAPECWGVLNLGWGSFRNPRASYIRTMRVRMGALVSFTAPGRVQCAARVDSVCPRMASAVVIKLCCHPTLKMRFYKWFKKKPTSQKWRKLWGGELVPFRRLPAALWVTWNEIYVSRVEAVFSVWLSTFAWLNKQTNVG